MISRYFRFKKYNLGETVKQKSHSNLENYSIFATSKYTLKQSFAFQF